MSLNDIRALIRPLLRPSSDAEVEAIQRMELLRAIMLTSNHLVCQIIARSLFEQLIRAVENHPPQAASPAHREQLHALDEALAARNRFGALAAMQQIDAMNRSGVLEAFNQANNANVVEVSI